MPKVTGKLTDFGFDLLSGHNPRLLFKHNTPGVSGSAIMPTRSVAAVPEYNGYFEADLTASARIAPAGYYTITFQWTDEPGRTVYSEEFPGRLYVPSEGGILADLLRVPSNPALVWEGKEPPANASPGTWWLDEDGVLSERNDKNGWTFKQNTRGPAGYNAVGATASQQAIADWVKETAGPNPLSAALDADSQDIRTQIKQFRDKGAPPPGVVRIDSFPGATGADQLRAAMTYAQAQTRRPALLVTPGAEYHAMDTPFQLYDGFQMIGPAGGETEYGYGAKVLVRGYNGGVFALKETGLTRGVVFKDIAFEGLGTANFLKEKPLDNSAGSLAYSLFDSVSFNTFKSVYRGTLTGVTWRGMSYIQNVTETALELAGSDCSLFADGLFVDQNYGTTVAQRAAGDGLIRLNNLSKSTIGPLYVTGDPGLCMWIGGSLTHALMIHGARLEGRNWATPAAGSLIRMADGVVTFRDCWTSYGMAAPDTTGRSETGIIQIWGGQALIDGGIYERAKGVSESVPYIVAGGTSKVTVRNIRGYKFTGKPVVHSTGGTVDADNSVTVTTGPPSA